MPGEVQRVTASSVGVGLGLADASMLLAVDGLE
jgi:hypothetical protein